MLKLIRRWFRHSQSINEPVTYADKEAAILAYLNDETVDAADYGRGVAGF